MTEEERRFLIFERYCASVVGWFMIIAVCFALWNGNAKLGIGAGIFALITGGYERHLSRQLNWERDR